MDFDLTEDVSPRVRASGADRCLCRSGLSRRRSEPGQSWTVPGPESLSGPPGPLSLSVILLITYSPSFLIFLGIVPMAGAFLGFVFARITYWIGAFLTPAASGFFRFLQIFALAGTAMVHGSNDGQKTHNGGNDAVANGVGAERRPHHSF